MTIEIGRLCIKIAGRDAGKKAVIIDVLDDKFVVLDGQTRRRKVNVFHIEPLNQVIKIEKNASHGDVANALKELGIETRQTKPKQKTERPKPKRKTPEQLRVQKEEKRKLRDIFRPKKKEEKIGEKKESTLEAKAGLMEEKKEEINPSEAEIKEKKAKPAEKKEEKPKAKKAVGEKE
ncbi:50S ribosomal protein L14e [Candidatus Woesearchaeota archaeon]|nr:50S ribosomal protein L14e [Candidatus Woesearchaeota archaeon]